MSRFVSGAKAREPEQWADESLALTIKNVYGLLPENRELGQNSNRPIQDEIVVGLRGRLHNRRNQ